MARGRTNREPALWHLDEPGPPDGPYVALAPGAEVPLLPLDLPPKLTGLARERVAQRVLAEQLSQPMTGLELRPWRRKSSAFDRVVIGEASVLTGWRGKLTGACEGLFPDYAALPCIPDVWTVAVDATVRARLGEADGFTAEPALAAAILASAAAPRAVLRLGDPSEPVDAAIAARELPVFVTLDALADAGHGAPLPWSQSVAGLDLKAPPSAGFDRIRAGLRRWAVPVAAALIALALWTGSVVTDTRQLQAQVAAARADTEAMLREHFVPAGPILDVRSQVESALTQVAPPPPPATDPLILFQTAAPMLAGEMAALQAISYRGDTGLVAAVELSDFAALERLVAALRGDGFVVEELDSAARQAGGVGARLRLSEAGF